MKKIRTLSLVLIAIMLLSLISCKQSAEGYATVIIGGNFENAEVYKIDLDKVEITEGAVSLLKYLSENKKIEFKTSGTMITKVGALENKGSSYIWLWTSEEKDQDTFVWEGKPADYKYHDTTVKSAAVGAFDMHISDGTVIYFGLLEY